MLYAIMRAQAACKESVAVSHRENIVAGNAVSGQATRHTLAPNTNVLAGIAHNRGIARSAATCMNADNLALRGSLKAERIVVAKVFLCGERQFLDVLDGLNVVGTNVHFLQFIAVERDIMIDVFNNLMESLALQGTHFVATHAFFIRIPNHILISYNIQTYVLLRFWASSS